MQHRMKTHTLTEEQIIILLNEGQIGSLATLNEDNTPYVTPVHFIYMDKKIFIHGLPKGQKIDNIIRNKTIGFLVYNMLGFLLDPDDKPCDTNTEYESVIIKGKATLIENTNEKRMVLQNIVQKYTPHLVNSLLPENMILGTAVIQISILELTGKYYN